MKKKLKEKIDNLQEELSEARQENIELDEENSNLKEEIIDLESEIEDLKNQLWNFKDFKDEVYKLENEEFRRFLCDILNISYRTKTEEILNLLKNKIGKNGIN